MINTGMGGKKIEGSDPWRQIFGAHNDTVEAYDDHLDAIQDGLAIVANGDTHAAVAQGQFVYVRNHDTLAEGLYKAAAAIAEDASLNTSNLVADGSGGLNDLKGQVDTLNSNIVKLSPNNAEWNNNVNLNNITDTGLYPMGQGLTNAPSSWGILQVIAPRNDTIEQVFYRYPHVYFREYRSADGWQNWVTVI